MGEYHGTPTIWWYALALEQLVEIKEVAEQPAMTFMDEFFVAWAEQRLKYLKAAQLIDPTGDY